MFSLLATVLLAGTTLAAAPSKTAQSEAPPSEVPPGGYWTLGEQREREREPLDGEDELTVGSVLFSLGLLRGGAGLLSVWMAGRPTLCPDAEQGCGGLRTFGWVGLGEGGLLAGTGIVYMAIGASRRRQHQRWERGESLARYQALGERVQLSPWFTGSRASTGGPGGGPGLGPGRLTGGGLVLQLRF